MEFFAAVNLGNHAQRLLYIIKQAPGIHLREVQRQARLGLGDTVYQIKKLISLGLIDSTRNGKYRRFYPSEVEADERNICSALLTPSRKLILLNLLSGGESTLSELADIVKLSKSTISWNLKILRSQGIVTTSEVGQFVYRLVDSKRVEAVIAKFKPSSLDTLSERFLQSWELLDSSLND